MPSALNTANVFLKLSQPEVGDFMTNLKVQKLLYYAQGFHLALNNGTPLFDEEIIAWNYGPVVEEVYHIFKVHGASPIPIPDEFDAVDIFTKEQLDLIEEVNEVYGQFSALKLMNLTHSERPWMETPKSNVITKELLFDFFKTRVEQS